MWRESFMSHEGESESQGGLFFDAVRAASAEHACALHDDNASGTTDSQQVSDAADDQLHPSEAVAPLSGPVLFHGYKMRDENGSCGEKGTCNDGDVVAPLISRSEKLCVRHQRMADEDATARLQKVRWQLAQNIQPGSLLWRICPLQTQACQDLLPRYHAASPLAAPPHRWRLPARFTIRAV